MNYTFFNKYNKEVITIQAIDINDAIFKVKYLRYINKCIYVKYSINKKIAVYYCTNDKKRYYFNYPDIDTNKNNLFFIGFKQGELIQTTLYL